MCETDADAAGEAEQRLETCKFEICFGQHISSTDSEL